MKNNWNLGEKIKESEKKSQTDVKRNWRNQKSNNEAVVMNLTMKHK